MTKYKKLLSFTFILSVFLFCPIFVTSVFASPTITSFLLNGSAQNVTFNPNKDESISIEVKSDTPVKFTRLYICSKSQECNGTAGNYIRYFSQTSVSDNINKTWDGSISSTDKTFVPAGEYKINVSMTEGTNDPVLEPGQYSIFVDFNSTNTLPNICTSFSYSTWGTCLSGVQTRTVIKIPTGCSGEPPEKLTNTCTSTPTDPIIQATKVVTRTVYISAHSGEEDLSDYNEKTAFEITAGRERMVLVGSPLEFDAKYKLSQSTQCVPALKWSFGDGFDADGKKVSHTYKYPGEYQIVLNGSCGEFSSVSRTTVRVNSPNISINNLISGDVEVNNKSDIEINIGKWKINNGHNDFVFPDDTIISANGKIIISKGDFFTVNLPPGYILPVEESSTTMRLSVSNPAGKEVAYFDSKKNEQQDVSSVALQKVVQNEISENIQGSSTVLVAKVPVDNKNEITIIKSQVKKGDEEIQNKSKDDLQNTENTIQTASVLESINNPTPSSFWSRIVSFPVNSIKSFARLFYDF